MRKLFALFLVATFILGDYTISHLDANASAAKDARAESLLSQARAALGGDAAINAVTNLVINGTVSHKINLPDTGEKTMTGKVEMALELPDKLHKKMNIGEGAPELASETGRKVVVKSENVLIDRSIEPGAEGSVRKFHKQLAGAHGNELAALVFGLLAKTSPAVGTVLNYLGEGAVDGATADIVEAAGGERGSIKIYLDKQSHLPLMVSYRGIKQPQMFIFRKEAGAAPSGGEEKDVVIFNHKLPAGEKVAAADGEAKVFVRKKGENKGENVVVREMLKPGELPRMPLEESEIQIRFSDYRSVNGLLLPHRLVEVVNGQETISTTVEGYQINAPNLAERFKNENVRVRVPKVEKIN